MDNAFPVSSTDYYDEKPIGATTHHGLSKREYFAAAALQGLMENPYFESVSRASVLAVLAADALIAELEKPTDLSL